MITQNSGIHVTDNYKLRERFRSAYEASVQIVEKIQNISAGDFVFPQPLEKFFFSFDAADDDETDPAGEEGKPAASNSNNGEVKIRDGYETPNESVNSQDIIPENNNNQKIELIESKSISTDTTNNVGEPKVVLDDLVKEVLEFSRSLRPPSKTLFPSMSLLSSSSSSFEEKLDMINSIQLEDPHPLISTRESISETELLPIKSSTSTTSSNLRTQKSVDQEITAQLESGYSDDDDDDDGTDDDTITLLTSTELSSSIKKDSSVSDTSSSRKSSLASNKIENIGDDDDNDDDDDTEDDIILFPVSNTKTSVNKGEAKETARIGAIVDDDDLSLDNDDFDDDDDDVFDNSSTGTGAAGSKSKSIVAKNDEINTSTSTSNDGYTPHNVAPDVAAELSKSGVRKPRHKKGTLTCKGKNIDSGVIYWRDVEGDKSYISPIIPPTDPSAHGADATRYLSFEYDAGGWNNMRMSMECLIVLAHAFNRTLVLPPPQHIYLLSQKFVAKVDGKKKVFSDEMGFEDFFHVDAMRSQEGMNIMSMKEFLTKEGITGGLNGIYPPGNNTDIWGRQVLWPYLDKVADILPVWGNSYFALPLPGHDYTFSDIADYPPSVQARFERWKVDREPINYYNQSFQRARHLHVPGEGHHRILMHHYCKYFLHMFLYVFIYLIYLM